MSVCKKACEILSKTRDGDGLSPEHLKFLEIAVNGYLNDTGNALFEKLHRDEITDDQVRELIDVCIDQKHDERTREVRQDL